MKRSDYAIDTLLNSIYRDNAFYEREVCKSFVFTKIPRTASSTIVQELKIRAKNFVTLGRYKKLLEFLRLSDSLNFNYNFNHMRIQSAVSKSDNDDRLIKILSSSYCFFFVRNPFDRMVSLYKLHVYNDKFTSTNKNGIYFNSSFNDFVYKYLEDGRSDKDANFQNKLSRQLGDSQYRWLHRWLNFIGRYENLENDFHYIKAILDLKDKDHKIKYNIKRYDDNYQTINDYRKYYISDRLIEKIYQHYKIDCDLFGYTFDKITKAYDVLYTDVMRYMNEIYIN